MTSYANKRPRNDFGCRIVVETDMKELNITPLEPAKALKTQAYEALKKIIGHMDIYSGEELPRLDERALGKQLGVSRTPVREAISRLEQEGLVQNIARRGAFVVRKSKEDILDMIDVWAALESMAARLATTRSSDSEIASLRNNFATFDDSEKARAHIDEYSETNIEFHQTIIWLGQVSADHPDVRSTVFSHARHSNHNDQGTRPGVAFGDGPYADN